MSCQTVNHDPILARLVGRAPEVVIGRVAQGLTTSS
jgi:hypothetical protein